MHLEVEPFDPALPTALVALPTVQHVTPPAVAADGGCALAVRTTDSRGLLPRVIETVTARSGRIRHVQIAQPTLEDVFITLTGKQLRE